MIDIIFEKEEAILKFPKQYVSADYVQQFFERLRLEVIVEKSKLTEEQAWELSENLKQEWWQRNKENLLKRIKN
jgi:hypothetical protein